MAGDLKSGPLYISGADRIRPDLRAQLLEAAEKNWQRIVDYTEKLLGDEYPAAQIMENVVHSAARTHASQPIEDLDSYIFSGAVRAVKRRAKAGQRIEHRDTRELAALKETHDDEWVSRLDRDLLLKEASECMNQKERFVFNMRSNGFSLKEIGAHLGVSDNAARMILNRGIEKARKRMKEGKM